MRATVIVTDACNLRCAYCSAPMRPGTLSDEHIDRLFALLAASPAARVDINLHGGEPTLAWDRVERVCRSSAALGASRPVSVNICTNGTALDASRVGFLVAAGANVRVSIDGRRADHDLHRRPRNAAFAETSYDETLGALRRLVAARARVSANLVTTPRTVGTLSRNLALLLGEGLDHVSISPVVGLEWPGEALLTLDRELRALPMLLGRSLDRNPERREEVRRAVQSEIGRAACCAGDAPGDARVLVVGADGRIFGDEPAEGMEEALRIGHLDTVGALEDLPALGRTTFQALFDAGVYSPAVALSVKRTHRLLRRHLTAAYEALFGSLRDAGTTDVLPEGTAT